MFIPSKFSETSLILRWVVSGMFVCLSWTAVGEEGQLFGKFNHGLSKSDLLKNHGIYDCSTIIGFGEWWCLEKAKFAEHEVEIAFLVQNDTVDRVMLLTEYSDQAYADFFGALHSRFELVMMNDGESTFDILQMAHINSQNVKKFEQDLAQYEREGLVGGQLTYTFAEKKDLSVILQGSNSVHELLNAVGTYHRFADLIITTDEMTRYLAVLFYLPSILRDLHEESTTREYEDF